MRDDLMKMIVHDLKTPLTSVLATTEMLIDGDFGPLNAAADAKCLATPSRRREDLLALIGDLLEVSRLEEATMTLDLQQIAPARAAQRDRPRVGDSISAGASATATVDVADDAPRLRGR